MSEPHAPSFYAATVAPVPERPVFSGEAAADVCVIGAGFSGLNVAIEMAERGRSVILLEAQRVGWGASGRNGGQVQGGFLKEPGMAKILGQETLDALRYRGQEIIAARRAKYAIDCDWRDGHIECAAKPAHARSMERDAESSGLRFVAKKDMPAEIGSERFHGGVVDMRNGYLNPLKLALGEAAAAESLGVKIYEGSEALDILPGDAKAGRKPVVVTAEGRVTAGAVVLAGDALHHLLPRKLDGAIIPAGSYIIATEPLDPEVLAWTAPQGLSAHDTLTILDYWRPSADGRMLYGGRCDYANMPLKNVAEKIRPRMIATYPQLAALKIDYAWGGAIGVTFTRAPQFGRVEGEVYYLQGYSGHGLNVSHIGAEIVAQAIAGSGERLDLFEKLPLWRLPGGSRFANPALALGMLWHRLLDAF
ncbi:NAD(P)/FAD-dependent oxidoreductase [Neomegalonema perideroedes]|uniref:NAD(P)/FAD-dependent oxidoreductase n=1 Tax=Neomegalonema perideroedes TaxID=217219 RepID=UPI000372D278|nr:FAD-binding oxidoreductase [Neomegalonema perideroedes]